jgi:hypothetical protein
MRSRQKSHIVVYDNILSYCDLGKQLDVGAAHERTRPYLQQGTVALKSGAVNVSQQPQLDTFRFVEAAPPSKQKQSRSVPYPLGPQFGPCAREYRRSFAVAPEVNQHFVLVFLSARSAISFLPYLSCSQLPLP